MAKFASIPPRITAQDSDNISRYFSEIRDFQPLTKERERKLLKLIQKNDDSKAMEELINANLKFVVSIAKFYQGQGVPLMDLVSEGNLGLMAAAKKFDVREDIKFFSYAVWWIRLQMFKSLYNGNRVIRLPDNRALMVTHIKREIDFLEQKLGRFPTSQELFEQCQQSKTKDVRKSSISDIEEAIMYGGRMASLQDKVSDGDGSEIELQSSIEDESLKVDVDDHDKSMNSDLVRLLFHLSQYEYDALALTMGLSGQNVLRNSDIAKGLKLVEKEVVRLKLRALRKLKNKVKNTGFDFLREHL